MRKKALLALMLAATLLLSGCALIAKDAAVDNAQEILRLGDQVFTKAEVKEQVDQQLYYNSYMSYYSGQSFDSTDPANIASAQDTVIRSLKNRMTIAAKAKELGMDQLTDEDLEEIKKEAQEDYDANLEYMKKNLQAENEGLEGEALDAAALKEIEDSKLTLDDLVTTITEQKISDRVREFVVKDVAVSDAEIEEEYNSRVESSKGSYGDNAASYASAVNNGSTIYYAPAGVRRVKQILTKFKDEDQTAITDARKAVTEANTAVSAAQAKIDAADETLNAEGADEESKADATADKQAAEEELATAQKTLEDAQKVLDEATDKAFANIDEETDAILASLADGADWDALMEEKNQDPGMASNPMGYAVAEGMTGFDQAFVDAAMAISEIGGHSDKVRGNSYGYYIIRYDSDVPEGPVALDDVKDTISSNLLATKQNNTYNETLAKWVEEAGIKVDLNALKD